MQVAIGIKTCLCLAKELRILAPMLTGHAIQEAVETGRLTITPFSHEQVGPNSYDVRLGPVLYRYIDEVLDVKNTPSFERIVIPDEGVVLHPHEFYLGATMEFMETKELVMQITGRSSTGRYGLSIHETAGLGDLGFAGHWTLEIRPCMPIRVYSGVKIGQVFFSEPQGDIAILYPGKYSNSPSDFEPRLPRPMI